MNLRSEDYAARGESQPSTFRGYSWVQVCPDCGTRYVATLLDQACMACADPVNPYRRWDR